jgi:hypothetical protein
MEALALIAANKIHLIKVSSVIVNFCDDLKIKLLPTPFSKRMQSSLKAPQYMQLNEIYSIIHKTMQISNFHLMHYPWKKECA